MKLAAGIVLGMLCLATAAAEEPEVRVSAAVRDEAGWLVHTVESPYQSGRTEVRVLLPDELDESRRYRVVYVLPVEALREHRFGDGPMEIRQQDLHNKHAAIFVAPTFSDLPWYADHPENPRIRQETYFLEVVVPLVEKEYPALAEPEGRLLLGYSKSGWGAWSLLLRHPETFGRAAAWDAPLMMDRAGLYGSSVVFGTQEVFEQYRVSDLLRSRAPQLQDGKRLILTGYGNFRRHHEQAHALLDELKIPHEYRDGPQRKHDWHSGWAPEAVELLLDG